MRNSRSQTRTKSAKNRSQSKSAAKSKKNAVESSDEEIIEKSPLRSNRKSVVSRNGKSNTQSQVDTNLYHKGTFVAFVDPSESLDKFKIAHLLDNLREDDEEVLVDVYSEMAAMQFQLSQSKVPITEYQIVCDVSGDHQVPKKRGQKATFKITRQQVNKVKKHMEDTVARLMQEQDESEDASEEDDESEDEESEASSQPKKMVMADAKTIQNRRILKISASAGKKVPATQPTTNVKAVKAESKSAVKPTKKNEPKKSAPLKKQDLDEEDMVDEQDDEVEIEMIDTSSKRRVPAKSQKITKNRKMSPLPKVGQKRVKRTAKNADHENDDEPSDLIVEKDESFNEDDDGESQPTKKRKLAGGKEKVVKGKKAPKMPTVFKKGKWNPDIQLLSEEKYRESKSKEPIFDCCIRCNNQNVMRAAVTNNADLLKKCMAAKDKISTLCCYESAEVKNTPLYYLITHNRVDLLEIMLHPTLTVPKHSTYDTERSNYYSQRVSFPKYLIDYVDSGMVSNMAYGTRVRKVQQTRGNRQGNNAFLEYIDNRSSPYNQVTEDGFFRKLLYTPNIEWETFKALYKLVPAIENMLQTNIYEAIRAGNRKIAYEVIKNMIKYPNFGFGQLHLDVLSDDHQVEKVLKQSITKKANTNKDVTPLHCACINPNPKYLKMLLDQNPDLNTIDQDLRKPVHYAAACEGPEPLQLLINSGASLSDIDNQKQNSLHIAAMFGRHENVKLILKSNPQLLNVKDKKSMNAMAYACKYGHIEVVKVLLENKVRINSGYGLSRMPPLCWAAAYGHYQLCEFLLENKARVLGKDKFKRTPLILAVRNGYSKIASLLLQRGSEWNHQDSSGNTPLHYAAAYGSLESIELLLKAGADVNSQNSWKFTPINIAMLKNHQGCVKRLLEEPNVDVNGKDEQGRTLIMLSLFVMNDETCDFVAYLLKKKADPNIADLQGQTTLHYVAKYHPKGIDSYGKSGVRDIILREIETQKKVVQLLIQTGADLTIKDKQKKTPFALCLDADNPALLEFLQDKVSINKEPELMFAFTSKILNVHYQKILQRLFHNDAPLSETINVLDEQGMTPFLDYIHYFVRNYANVFQMILDRVNNMVYRFQADLNRYKITNEELFDKNQARDHNYVYSDAITQEQKNEVSFRIMNEIVVKPLIEFLKFLIFNGADPKAQVHKLKKFRDLEAEHKLKLAQIQAGAEPAKAKVEEEVVKKREEKLKEMNGPKKQRIRGGFPPSGNPFQSAPAIQQVQEDVIEKHGKNKNVREYSQHGLRNAIHLVIERPEKDLFDFLLSLQIDADLPDYDQVTPFNLMSVKSAQIDQKQFKYVFEKLIKMNVRVDFPDKKGRTPFLNYYDAQNFELAYRMLDMGANVNQMDVAGMFALKLALIRRHNNKMQELLDRGANINQIDNKGRNLLHHAINMSSSTADATFESERFLIEKGIDINLRDNKNRTPIHYAFVKIGDWKRKDQIDPIETVSSLCGIKGLELDVPDKWQKTPLHYASQRGASICAMYMQPRGASLESKDIYGNTPLGIGINNGHFNYGIILIQKGASVLPHVFIEDPERIQKVWDLEKKESKKRQSLEEDVEMAEESQHQYAVHKKKKHQNMFQSKSINYMGDDDYGDEYDDEEDEEDSDEQAYENVYNQQNAFGMTVFNRPQKAMAMKSSYHFGGGFNQFGQPMPAQQQPTGLVKESDKEGVSMFKLAIRGGQQGLAYLMLDNQYNLMHAVQDALDEKKFMLVLTLMSKVPDDSVIQQTNAKGQNLFHILSMNAGHCSFEHLERIYQGFKQRGVNCRAKDNFGRTALHYAVMSESVPLVKMILAQEQGYNVNEVDNDGFTPFALYIKGNRLSQQVYNPVTPHENIFYLLVKKGADVNVVYPEELYKPAFKEEELLDEYCDNYDLTKYKCSALINLIRINPANDILRNNLVGLIEHGAKLNVVDSDGRDPIMHGIMNDNAMFLKILLENQRTLHVNPKGQDYSGKSAVHYVVTPIKYGSYENVEILNLLHKYKFEMQLKDSYEMLPSHYAAQQESQVMLNEIAKLTGQVGQLKMFQRKMSMIESDNWPSPQVDFESDAETFIEMAKEKELKEKKQRNEKIPVDKTGKFTEAYEVYYDENDKPWDIYMTKVDLKNGIYGDYVFYKMQLLYDSNREMYLVFTRWGRIGEDGMNQRSPFNNLDEAKIEFRKIFKQKTGGNNFDELDRFQRVKKKYNITRVNYVTVDYKDYLQPFDFEKCPKSRLNQQVYELFEEMSNVTMYQRAIGHYGIDQSVLPFSSVKKESLVEARQILMEIQELLKEDTELSKQGINADYDALVAVKEKVAELSSRYYELIPQERFKNQIAPPINSAYAVKNQYDMLDSLTNIEFASKMLLGAVLKQKEMNPVDYIFKSVNMMIEPLDKRSPEYEVLHKYIDNTRNVQEGANAFGWNWQHQYHNQYEITNIFRIQRKGEAEMIQSYKDVPNHFLLYHGSTLFNFLGIMSQGLRIAPPEAPVTGYMFGKGVYFADMFDKSFAYSTNNGYAQQDSYLMLMCEVALGKSKELYQPENVENLEAPYLSVKGIGRRGPGYKHTIVLPNGVKIPYGKVIDYHANNQEMQRKVQLQHNEYIVYNTQQIRMRYVVQISKKKPEKQK